MNQETVRKVITRVVEDYISRQQCDDVKMPGTKYKTFEIPAEVSGRHVHLCQEDIERLFGEGHVLTEDKAISQPGQFLSKDRVTIAGPGGELRNVAVLGPAREATQVEVSLTDARTLGIDPPVALSGDLRNAADITIAAGETSITVSKCCIVARNHIHMAPEDLEKSGLKDGATVDVAMVTKRPITYNNVIIRSGPTHKLALHIDYDEANACQLRRGDKAVILMNDGGACACSPERETITSKKYLSEQDVKAFTEDGKMEITVTKDTVISPLAKDYLSSKSIKVVRI